MIFCWISGSLVYKIAPLLHLISKIGLIFAGVVVERWVYAEASSSILTSAAPKERGYQYSIWFFTPESPKLCKNGFATCSPPRAKNIFTAGIFLLNPSAFLRGNGPSNLPSALFGVSLPTEKGIS